MRTIRRLPVIFAMSVAAALAAPAACPGAADAAARRDPIGGAQLGGNGVVVNPAPGVPEPPKIDASSWIIADGDTGAVLAAKDPHGQYLPASTLKTLTSITLIPKLDRTKEVRPSQAACDVAGTKVGMTPKLSYKIEDLFRALLLMSANDAAVTLTEAGGGYKESIAAMNAEAKRLQAGDTLAASPNGLDVDLGLDLKTQHSSAYDLALIMRQGLKLADFKEYVGTVNATFPIEPSKDDQKKGKKISSEPIYSHDRLLPGEGYHYPGMIGGKNGYTVRSQQTFVGAARRNGHTIIIALMHGTSLWKPATELLDWGFAADGKVRPVGTLVDPVDGKKPGSTASVAATDPTVPTPAKSDWMPAAIGAGSVAALLASGTFFLLMRRRRRRRSATARPPRRVSTPTGSHDEEGARRDEWGDEKDSMPPWDADGRHYDR